MPIHTIFYLLLKISILEKDKEKNKHSKMKKNVPFRYGPTITNYH
ncbi:hypothetical protein BACUNI_00665 [Bacteroides uniformis ATCC 8492]|jgi:hypothetical protein|uniref:Uncharacterized protein n=1 Tax=Bacteroides uniformis (strain ATCC 8492 / DSM 6597 / CCUG 4942 / CIP 103695 / JCM 5828 / KCTC 5204 / NCTC 13054 / VPI 0061) TaxID=411479 RepID=A0ABC9NFT7_BACUC|nr:hypothetical protein BACUNI_00665 [Bacteroides uniformis ATCC 8492]